ncbi:sulfotransferase [Reichenbachiella sp. MALMAid0571]|uniref:sulfotransferase family protein n=1 Tax=Reichenbachiella sp. MALMAid0571 TaxID=3143939 RepID=UPI0032DFC2E1
MKKIKLARLLLRAFALFPKKYKLRSRVKTSEDPFFIFGSGRNGSTLLNVILNQHPEIFLPPEQYFIGNSIIKFQLYNHILWRDLVKIIYGELVKETGSHSWNFDPGIITNQAFLFEGEQRNMENILHHIYSNCAGQNGKSNVLWGDSTPMNTRYLNEIYSCFPNAKYIFLVRDGRDVTAAYKKGKPETFDKLINPEHSSDLWIKSIKKYNWLKKRTNVLLVKYEDLVSTPETELKKIIHYLNREFDTEMLNFQNKVPDIKEYQESHHKNLHTPIKTTSIGQWKELLNASEKELVSEKLNPYLKQFNYQ